jgi:hypothetical protein
LGEKKSIHWLYRIKQISCGADINNVIYPCPCVLFFMLLYRMELVYVCIEKTIFLILLQGAVDSGSTNVGSIPTRDAISSTGIKLLVLLSITRLKTLF